MGLETLYQQVKEAISRLDFHKIWPGFAPLRFALYDQESCYFDGGYIQKTDDFCANTSICFQGEQIAIWMVTEELDISVLTSKLVHEMFHGYQTIRGWDCWPDEMEALYNYRYDAGNLSLRLHENELLLELLDRYDRTSCRELLASRKYRCEKYPYEFSYESRVEEIEGTANYVEWQVLKQLDPGKASALTDHMRAVMTKPEYLFPIRISSYYTGAPMINALLHAGMYTFEPSARPAGLAALKDIDPSENLLSGSEACLPAVTDAIRAFRQKTGEIIRAALDRNDVVLHGPLELAGLNIYNARSLNGYLTSTYFLMYRDGEENKVIRGNFVIRMKDEKTIDTVYRLE